MLNNQQNCTHFLVEYKLKEQKILLDSKQQVFLPEPILQSRIGTELSAWVDYNNSKPLDLTENKE